MYPFVCLLFTNIISVRCMHVIYSYMLFFYFAIKILTLPMNEHSIDFQLFRAFEISQKFRKYIGKCVFLDLFLGI